MKSIFVGNLPFSATEEEISDLFAQFGVVHSARLINDRESGRPRGFGFVKMDDAEALAAIQALNGSSFGGRNLRINEAEDRPPADRTARPPRSGGETGTPAQAQDRPPFKKRDFSREKRQSEEGDWER